MEWCVINHKDDALLSEHMEWILGADVRLATSELEWLKKDNIPFDHDAHLNRLNDFENARKELLDYIGYDDESGTGSWILLVMDDGAPVAMAHCNNYHNDEVWSVGSVYVEDVHRGKGVGKGMMEFIRNTAKTYGGKQVQLSVYTRNKKAHGLYSKLGFKSYMEDMTLAL